MDAENLQTDLSLTTEIKLYYDLYTPENTGEKLPLLIAVHGYGAHKRYMMREARLIAPENFIIAAIQAPYPHFRPVNGSYKIGFGWLTDYKAEESVAIQQKFVLDVIEKLESEEIIDSEKIFLYGFSQACALNFRFALTHPKTLRGVIGVCGASRPIWKQIYLTAQPRRTFYISTQTRTNFIRSKNIRRLIAN